MPLDPILIERFALLFAGLTRAKGRYVNQNDPSRPVVAGEKTKGKATTITETVTLEDYRRHLEGEQSLGIVPIRDDGTCVFGAIDVDQYAGLDHVGIIQAIRQNNLPAVVCRSKSGGAHVYTFVQEPGIKATAFIEYLKKTRTQVGIDYKKAREIFPKQAKQSGGIGNWINLPYFGTTRPALKEDGSEMSLEEFINSVQRVDASTLTQHIASEDGLVLTELPPCLERLAQDGIPAGMRNEALFNFTVFACKKFHMDRRKTTSLLDVINMRVCQPPVPSNELRQTLDSVLKHEYNYRCDISPLVDVCDKALCATRPFGPSCSMHANDLPEIERIEIKGEETNETQYGVKLVIVPKTVYMDSKTLNDYELFRRAIQDTAHVRLPDAKKKDWDAYLTARWESLKITIRSAQERSKKGVMLSAVDEWIKVTATTEPERYSLGRPLLEGERIFIGISDLFSRLKQLQPRLEYAAVVSLLEDNGWEKCTKVIAGRTHDNVWTKAISEGDVSTEKEVVKEVDGHIVVEVPQDLPAGSFEEYDDFSKFNQEQDES